MNRAQESARNADEMEYVYDFRGIPLHCRIAIDKAGPVLITECLLDGDDFDIVGIFERKNGITYAPLTGSILLDAHIAWENGK